MPKTESATLKQSNNNEAKGTILIG